MSQRSTFRTCDGTNLAVYDWPVEDARLSALVVHGLGEHAGRYELLARWLNAKGVAVRAYDQLGMVTPRARGAACCVKGNCPNISASSQR